MATYFGFSTIGANLPRSTNVQTGNNGGFGNINRPINSGRKYKLTDSQLVIQDLINAFNIRQGQKVGQPGYGTTLWDFVFEPNDLPTQEKIKNEVFRVLTSDPRVIVNYVSSYPRDNGILIEVEISVSPFNQAQVLSLFADSETNQLSQQ
jgi:phage baseplate assembly protein W